MLCDFGLAQSEFRSGLETSGDFAGAIAFCSPELLRDVERSPSSDMWALGCLVIEIVLGVKPFAGVKTSARTITIILEGGLPASEEALRRPVNMWDGLIRCWHFDPKDRVQVSEFSKYWDLKIRSADGSATTEEPVRPRPTCSYRRQWLDVHNILDSIDRIFATVGLLAVLTRSLMVFYTILDRLRYNDQSGGRALRALEALPWAKMAPWSAVDARSSCLGGTRVAVLKDIYKWYSNTARDAPLPFNLDGIAGVGKTTIAHTSQRKPLAMVTSLAASSLPGLAKQNYQIPHSSFLLWPISLLVSVLLSPITLVKLQKQRLVLHTRICEVSCRS
ncbi:hypothetical protein FRB95_008217 [Tulasnella sp. JGI-2019a]|nr:hypothetical protein FRB95_008217 [Tulasnella sp. JGI-2019a]